MSKNRSNISAEKILAEETMKELYFLENETESLLKSMRKIPAAKRRENEKSTPKQGTSRRGTKRQQRELGGTSSMDYTTKFQSTLEKTRNLFSNGEGGHNGARITVEVLDEASPDTTPRLDFDPKKLKSQRKASSLTSSDGKLDKNIQSIIETEQHYSQLPFQKEKTRALVKDDVFVLAPTVTASDVDFERQRLARIEEASRLKQIEINKGIILRKEYLSQDRAAIKIQALLRGHLGRKKFLLTKRLDEMLHQNDTGNDWVEVRDDNSGDIWYYNTKLGISQWERPVEMRNTLTGKAKLKKLPTLNQSSSTTTRNKMKSAPASSTILLPSLDKQKDSINLNYGLEKGASTATATASSTASGKQRTRAAKEKVLMSSSMSRLPLHSQDDGAVDDTDTTYMGQGPSHQEIQQEIRDELGVNSWMPPEGLSAPDGSFRPQLRTAVREALSDHRFSSLGTVLADGRWMTASGVTESHRIGSVSAGSGAEMGSFAEGSVSRATTSYIHRIDPTMKPMVSVLTFNKKKGKRVARINLKQGSDGVGDEFDKLGLRPNSAPGEDSHLPSEITKLTLRDVAHPGFDRAGSSGGTDLPLGSSESSYQQAGTAMCFGCWSAGNTQGCTLHSGDSKVKPSQTMLLCRNWDLGIMRRRYRSEEIQELFMKKAASLKYDVKRKKFLTVSEQRHPIYRLMGNLLERFNFKSLLIIRVKRWLWSFTEVIRSGTFKPLRTADRSKLIRLRRSLTFAANIQRYSDHIRSMMPIAPTTGYSWPERIETEKYLFTRFDKILTKDVEVIIAYPTPEPIALYIPKEFHLSPPISIPMPTPTKSEEAVLSKVPPSNQYIPDSENAAWIERLASSLMRDAVRQASEQITALTPISYTDRVRNAKYPVPTTVKFATLGRKPTPGMLAVNGLPVELVVAQLITTYIPAQYGNMMVMDKAAISPGVSPEVNISFNTLPMQPITQPYKQRPVDHPLNYRRAPTVGINSMMEDHSFKYYYGLNRPEQTGEEKSHGFRTSIFAEHLPCIVKTEAHSFTPGSEIATLNATSNHLSITTHADSSYPFCDPSTRDNTTLDFYHLLLTGTTTMNKPQVFTALTVQEPGDFLKQSRPDLPMGHLIVSVYRSWAFVQRDIVEEFTSDEGIKYWYNRNTGQTFWERPLYAEEKVSPLRGGTLLDTDHPEEPMTLHKGTDGRGRRYLQGELRKNMLVVHEDEKQARLRRENAHLSAAIARNEGILQPLEEVADILPDDESLPLSLTESNIKANNDVILAAAQEEQDLRSIATHVSEEAGLMNEHGRHRSLRSPQRQLEVLGRIEEFGSAEEVSKILRIQPVGAAGGGGEIDRSISDDSLSEDSPRNITDNPNSESPAIDMSVLSNLTATIGQMLSTTKNVSPQDMIQLGVGVGIALMQSQAQNQQLSAGGKHSPKKVRSHGDARDTSTSNSNESKKNNQNRQTASEAKGGEGIQAQTQGMAGQAYQDIGAVYPSNSYSEIAQLDHLEENKRIESTGSLLLKPLTGVEKAAEAKVTATITPDVKYDISIYEETPPMNADEAVRNQVPVQAYPELFTRSVNDKSELAEYRTHPAAGIGKSFVLKKDADSQIMIPGSKMLRRTVAPLPIGFFDSIKAKHIAKQNVDYLPQVPNLPQTRTVGRVKPRSAAVDWMAISFDPWSAGKNPLSTEFIPSLQNDMEKLHGMAKAKDEMDAMRLGANDGVLDIKDRDGLSALQVQAAATQQIAEDFKKMCSFARNGKFSEVEEMMNQPDWNVPIDYQDETGNALIHICAQNGNKRMIKLCLRRGANINMQNINGQTPLHFAYAYGYEKLGEYIIRKGGDDSIRNKDGLTCYEGLSGADLSML